MIYAITLILLVLFGRAGPVATCDPALTDLFTPARPVEGRYEACVSPEALEANRSDGFTYTDIEALEALDAFGSAGRYDRSTLSQLYGGRRVRVMRGWRRDGARFESVTLLSPYPDAALARLNEGTLILRWIRDAAR